MAGVLWKDADGVRELIVPHFDYDELDHDSGQQRFLVLHPYPGSSGTTSDHVRCSFDVTSLDAAEPFIAVRNSRGYRLLQNAIEIDGRVLIVPAAIEIFLRHFRSSTEPKRLWFRYVCLVQADKEERERYWTRPFVESMYDRAVSTIDMNDFLVDLCSRGVVERSIDSRYKNWTKMWNGTRDVNQLPKVFPIRLGSKSSLENPTDNFDHVPLDIVADEIRVLGIVESSDPSAPLVTHLAHCPIHSEVAYHCLSYTWGKSDDLAEIIVNGQLMRVRKNLESALRSMRHETGKVVVWIDAISIDQQNDAERNRQVLRMSEIYDAAIAVICYLGEPDDDSASAMEFMMKLQEPMMRFNKKGNWDIGGNEPVGVEEYPRLCAALYKLLTRPYFRRIWILQEVAVASNPTIACGDRFDRTFEKLDMATYNLIDMLDRDPRLASQMEQAMPDIGHVTDMALAYSRKLFYFRHLQSFGENVTMMGPVATIAQTSPGYLETAILARDFESTEPHDKLFALWNLAKDKDGLHFKVDYTQSISESYTNFTRAWGLQHGSLDIVGTAESNPKSHGFYTTAPSWCTDWSVPSETSSIVRREKIPTRFMAIVDALDGALYSADGAVAQPVPSPYFEFTEDNKKLLCTGIILDTIDHTFPEPPEVPNGYMFQPPDCVSYFKYNFWLAALELYFHSKPQQKYESIMQAATAMFHGDVESSWPYRDLNPDNVDKDYGKEQYVCNPKTARHIKPYAGSYDRIDAGDAVRTVLRGRTLFVSEQGYIGLAPIHVRDNGGSQKPFLLAILATCSVPVILQETDDGGSYRFCGSAFVQGWMEGEVLRDQFAVEELLEDFWDGVRESGMLEII